MLVLFSVLSCLTIYNSRCSMGMILQLRRTKQVSRLIIRLSSLPLMLRLVMVLFIPLIRYLYHSLQARLRPVRHSNLQRCHRRFLLKHHRYHPLKHRLMLLLKARFSQLNHHQGNHQQVQLLENLATHPQCHHHLSLRQARHLNHLKR